MSQFGLEGCTNRWGAVALVCVVTVHFSHHREGNYRDGPGN